MAALTSLSPVTPELAAAIVEATKAIPPSHLIPIAGEAFDDKKQAFLRINNWAFTQGFTIATESGFSDRARFQFIHHHKKIRNWRKTALEERRRVETKTKAKCYKWAIYISQIKDSGRKFILGWSNKEHNHPRSSELHCVDDPSSKRRASRTHREGLL